MGIPLNFPNTPTIGDIYPVTPAAGQPQYIWDGEKWSSGSLAYAPSSGTAGVIRIVAFTASGTYTPSTNMTTCVIECQGGGGGGGGSAGFATGFGGGGGGGAGAYSRRMQTAADIGASQSVTIGVAGSGGAAGANPGGAGGNTSLGSLCIAFGGSGGAAGPVGTGGAGGVAGTGDVAARGAAGTSVLSGNITTINSGNAQGATSYFGGPATATAIAGGVITGQAAVGFGGGGNGGAVSGVATTVAGGSGSPGLVVITEYGMIALSSGGGAVRYDTAQSLTSAQASQARSNIALTKKNYIINGAMMVSQENGTASAAVNDYYAVDQFMASVSGTSGIYSAQQIANVTPGGSPNRFQLIATAADAAVAATDLVYITQRLEGLRIADLLTGTAAAKTITVQFGVKAPAGTYCVSLRNGPANRSYVAEYVIAAGEANTSVVKSVTFTLDTTGTWPTNNTLAAYLSWSLMAGSTFQTPAGAWVAGNFIATPNQFNFMGTVNNIFELFDVSLTEGTVAPPFMVPDYASELAACQRYWQTQEMITDIQATVANQTAARAFSFSMRAAPTWTAGALYVAGVNVSAPVLSGGTQFPYGITLITTSIAAGRSYYYGPVYFNARL